MREFWVFLRVKVLAESREEAGKMMEKGGQVVEEVLEEGEMICLSFM